MNLKVLTENFINKFNNKNVKRGVRLRYNKRASLELSIRAIVIVVLAMTLMGLGLGFIRSQFQDITSLNVEVQEQVKEQITAQLRTSGEKLSFPSTVQMNRGERKTLTLGVQNTGGERVYFGFNIDWDQTNSDHYVAYTDNTETSFTSEYNPRYLRDVCSFSLDPSEASAYGLNIKAPSTAGTDMVVVKIITAKKDAPGNCLVYPDGHANAGSGQPDAVYATKTSFITVG